MLISFIFVTIGRLICLQMSLDNISHEDIRFRAAIEAGERFSCDDSDDESRQIHGRPIQFAVRCGHNFEIDIKYVARQSRLLGYMLSHKFIERFQSFMGCFPLDC